MEPPRIKIDEAESRSSTAASRYSSSTRAATLAWTHRTKKYPGAVRLHYSDLGTRLDEVPRDRTIVAYCT